MAARALIDYPTRVSPHALGLCGAAQRARDNGLIDHGYTDAIIHVFIIDSKARRTGGSNVHHLLRGTPVCEN